MSTPLPFKLTTGGLAAAWNATYTGLSLDLTHVQLGSGNRDPDGTETALVTPEQSIPIAAGFSVSPTQIRLSAIFTGNTGFNINEIGVWAGDPGTAGSVLVAYWSQASGTLAVKSPGVDFIFAHDLVLNDVVPAGSLTILADGAQSALLALIMAHEAAPDPHPQYLKAASSLPAGTRMLFAQATAPTGWTQITDSNWDNRLLRMVAGAGGGAGGSHSPILMDVVPAHTHGFAATTGTESADHTHGVSISGHPLSHNHTISEGVTTVATDVNGPQVFKTTQSGANPQYTFSSGSGNFGAMHEDGVLYLDWSGNTSGISSGHYHGVTGTTDSGSSQTNWTPRYQDVIVAEKNS